MLSLLLVTIVHPLLPLLGNIVNVCDYGATGDGVTNDRAAFQAAFEAVQSGGVLVVPAGTYRLNGNLTTSVAGNLVVAGIGNPTLELQACMLGFSSISGISGLVLPAQRGDTIIRLPAEAGVQPGNLLFLTCNVDAETAWGYNKQDIHRVVSVNPAADGGNEVRLATSLNFAYDPDEPEHTVKIYPGYTVDVAGLAITAAGGSRLDFFGLGGGTLSGITVTEVDPGYRVGTGILWSNCLDMAAVNIAVDGFFYGLLLSCVRNFHAVNIRANDCNHAVAPCNFADGVFVNGLIGTHCAATMDAHPSFNIHYNNVTAQDSSVSNLRSIGGSIRNSVFNTSHAGGGGLFQSVSLVDTTIYNEYDFLVDNVQWNAPNASGPYCGMTVYRCQRAIFRDSTLPGIAASLWMTVGTLEVDNCTLGYLFSRAVHTSVRSSTVDKALFNAQAGEPGLVWLAGGSATFTDSTFANAPYVVYRDYYPGQPRLFNRCRFIDITTSFDHMGTTGYGTPGADYTYSFDTCDIVRVFSYGAEISGHHSRTDDCTFSPGFPVLAPLGNTP